MAQINDQLLNECASNNRKSQSELYRLSFNLLLSIAFRYHKNKEDAMAVLNLGFLKILLGLEGFLKKNNSKVYKAWSSRIMINTIIDEYRKNKKRNEIISEMPDFPQETKLSNSDYNTIENNVQAEFLQNLLNELPKSQKTVFNIFAIDGYKHKEIAKMLSISVGNSKWCLSIARKRLQGMINKDLLVKTKDHWNEQ